MQTLVPPGAASRLARPAAVVGLTVLVLVSFAVPFYGPLLSVGLPFATHAARHRLWPDVSRSASLRWSLLAWVGLWWPAVLGMMSLLFLFGDEPPSSSWLLLPLCGPDSAAAVLMPAVGVALTCLVGLVGSAVARRPWPWVVAAWLAPWVHQVVLSQVGAEWIC